MTLCCRCNAGGKCRNCVCVKSKRQCSNCLPSRKGCCSNMKLSPALQEPDAAHISPVPRSYIRLPSQPSPPHVSPDEATITTMTNNDATTAQASGVSRPPNSAQHASSDPVHGPSCSLPPASPMPNPVFVWGDNDSASIMKSMDETYAEVVHWRKNAFRVPFGNAGKGFVSELSRLFRAYADGSALEAIALKACTVMPILLLQKPFRTSKQKDHSVCLTR